MAGVVWIKYRSNNRPRNGRNDPLQQYNILLLLLLCFTHYVQVQRSRCSPPMYFFLLLLLLSCPTFLLPARHSPVSKSRRLPPLLPPLAIPLRPPSPPPHSRQPSFVPPPGINFWDWHRPVPIRPGTRESPRRRPHIYMYTYSVLLYPTTVNRV